MTFYIENLAFDAASFGKPRPDWTKHKKVDLDRLGDFILTRTPPHAFRSAEGVWMSVFENNQFLSKPLACP